MTKRRKLLIFSLGVVLFMYFFIKYQLGLLSSSTETFTTSERLPLVRIETEAEVKSNAKSTISIAVAVCGDRWKETFVLIKSALLLTQSPVHVYIFADTELMEIFNNKLTEWQVIGRRDFRFDVLPVKFPEGEFETEWRKLFKPCASQRLFLPGLLKDVDSVLYVDTDTLFLGPLEQIWSHFSRMNSSQFAALAPEHEDPLAGWYNRFARHPFYKPLGVNTGVMLMNLTRMRKFEWERYLLPIYKKYKLKIPWGDQDIINIIFHFHPDKLYIYPCNYNYRADHCMYSSVCKEAEREGIIVVHGSRGIFHNNRYPSFQSVYKAVEEYNWGSDLYKDFYLNLERYLNTPNRTNCGKMKDSFLRNVKKYINVCGVGLRLEKQFGGFGRWGLLRVEGFILFPLGLRFNNVDLCSWTGCRGFHT